MKSFAISILFLLVLVNCEETVEPVTTASPDMNLEIISLVNEHRISQDLSPLVENALCSTVAEKHSQNMADGTTDFGHDGFESRTEEISASLNMKRIGENVAFGQTSADQVMNSWINSEGHRENIEGDFTDIGVGIAEDSDGRLYFTQIFIKL